MKKVLIVDDEKDLVGLVSLHMKMAGFQTIFADDGYRALDLVRVERPDLVILDIMLPEIDGWEICRTMRLEKPHLPIILLTALSSDEDRAKGFDLGADDYVTKPFSPRELAARVKRILSHVSQKEELRFYRSGSLEVNLADGEVKSNGETVLLTPVERKILTFLASRSGELVTHDQLMDAVWSHEADVEYGNIAVHIRNLRRKIEVQPSQPCLIQNVKGLGYRLDEV